MKKVYKWALAIDDAPQEIAIYEQSRILHCDFQNEQLCIWIEFGYSEDNRRKDRYFRVFGTGHLIPDNCQWVATVQQPPFVWHVYEEVR